MSWKTSRRVKDWLKGVGEVRGRQTFPGESFWGKMEVSKCQNGSKVCSSASFVVNWVFCLTPWLCEKENASSPRLPYSHTYVHLAIHLDIRRIDTNQSVGRIPIDLFIDPAAQWRGSSPTSDDLSGRNCLNISGGTICPWPILRTKENVSNSYFSFTILRSILPRLMPLLGCLSHRCLDS